MIVYDGLVDPATLTAFARSVPLDVNFVLDQILPDQVDQVLDVEWSESTSTTRAAKAREFDAPPLPGRRDGFRVTKTQLPAVGQLLGLGERDRLELERLRSGGSSTAALVDNIYDDTQRNVESVQARVEIMRGSALSTGRVVIPELGGIEADFQVPPAHFPTAAVLWSNHSCDMIGDIRAWNVIYRLANGFSFGGMIVTEDILGHMLQNAAIRGFYTSPNGGIPPLVTVEQLNAVLTANRLPTVRLVYDAQVLVDEVATRIFPNDKITFLPPAGIPLGRTQWGMTATGLELQNAGIEVEPSPAGIVAVEDKDVRPPYRSTAYVDATVMPVITRPKALFVADVL